jgi:uncharacterized membrane protein
MQFYVLLTIFAAFFYGISIVFQRRGLRGIPEYKILSGYKINFSAIKKSIKKILNRYFVFGILIGSVGSLLYLKAMSTGEVSIIQPLTYLSVIVTWILGSFYLKEKLHLREWISIFLILIGAMILSVIA